MPKLSINLLGWNHDHEVVKRCIQAVLASDYDDFELVYSDNGSENGLLDFVRSNFSDLRLRLVDNGRNLGYAGGQNKFFHGASSEFVMVLNPDAYLDKNFIKNILSVFQDGRVAAASGKMLKPSAMQADSEKILDGTGIVICKNRKAYERGQLEKDSGQYDSQRDIFGVSGTATVFRKSALEQVRFGTEYFDEDFFAYWEDLDLSWRLHLAGFSCAYVPEAVVYHERLVGQSGASIFNIPALIRHRRQFSKNVVRWNWRNHLFAIIKNDFGWAFWKDAPLIAAREAAMLVYFLFFDWRVFGAFPDFFRLLPRMLRKRAFIQSHRKVSSAEMGKWFR